MAKKIQAWQAYGPRLKLRDPVTSTELTRSLIEHTNQTKGTVLGVLSETDVIIEAALKAGRPVRLPNGVIYTPVIKKDGSITIKVRVPRDMTKRVSAEFTGPIENRDGIGMTEAEAIAKWNAAHPTDLIE